VYEWFEIDEYGQRKASGAANYHRDATLGVDGHLKSVHLVREVANTLKRGLRRMKTDERHGHGGQAAVVDRLNQVADELTPDKVTHDASHTVYAGGHTICHTDQHTRANVRAAPHVCLTLSLYSHSLPT
jgi:hypothetical protein